MKPYPKPIKKEKVKMTANDFQRLYRSKKISISVPRKGLKKKTPSENFYGSTAWIWFRRFVMTFYANPKDYTVPNFTSNRIPMLLGSKNTHLGHFIKVFESGANSHMATAFDFRNVLPQSYQDNRIYSGKPDIMAKQIDLIHGAGTADQLIEQSKQFKKYTTLDLQELGERYKQMTYNLIEKKGMKKWW